MTVRPTTRTLSTFICGTLAGTLSQDEHGLRSFRYESDYNGPPLSLSMPISNKTYRGRIVDAYLLGLLPDDERVRREAGRRFGVSGNNPFALLSHMGLDCPGAVQFCRPEDEDCLFRPEELRPLSEREIAKRLVPASKRQEDTWIRTEERWSLGGNQAKFALRLQDGKWYECHGAAASTHIFKPGIEGMRLEALDEYVTMKVAQACGLPTEQVDYLLFDGVPAIVATRYDREVTYAGIRRIHQEDFCQALSYTPDMKYAEDGGPSTPDVIALLRRTSDAVASLEAFSAMLFFNYLLGAPDSHAKNYSLVHVDGRTCLLAPLYDVASGIPYNLTGKHPLRMAMSIGGENRLGFVDRSHVTRFAQVAGIEHDRCLNLMANLCERIPIAMESVLEGEIARNTPGADELAERLLPSARAHCVHILQQL
ncbi:MAG: type II toxin-antitoxin system HipA family toxin [Coriobacteriales bacterium]|nr:type II toxin-antitoxin system HipA family toxin [Coriobacteriales bacterium]